MPQVYLIVRFDSTNESKPSYRTHDITITGMPIILADDHTRLVKDYTIIDDKALDGPWTYRVAVDIIKMAGKGLHISYGATSRDEALQKLDEIPYFAKESDKERRKDDHVPKARSDWLGETCVRIKLREDSYCWYELISADVEDLAKYKAVEESADHEEDRKRRRMEVEDAVGEDMDIFEDEEDEEDEEDAEDRNEKMDTP